MSLLIPARRQATDESFPVSPSAVKQLLHTLHPVDTAEQAHELYKGLKHSNRLDIPNHQRLEIASLFKPVVERLVVTMAQHYKDHALPLPTSSAKAWQLIDSLLQEMAFTHKIIVNDTYASLLPGQTKTRTTGMYQALQWLARRAEHHLMVYRALPDGVLQDANELYQLAEQSAIVRQEFTDDTNGHRFDWTLERAYTYLQLLALCAPNKIRARQIPLIFRWLHTNLEKVPIMTVLPDRQKSPSCYVIHAEQDIRPQSAVFNSGDVDKNTRFIDLNRLLGAIDHAAQSAPPTLVPRLESDTLTQHTLASLRESFYREHARETARAVAHKAVKVESGLANLLASLIYSDSHPESAETHDKPAATSAEPVEYWPNLPEHRPGEWHLVNESRLGIGLEWFNPVPARVEVGDVIGIKRHHKSRGHVWYVGLVQWMNSLSEQRLAMGVQFLSHQARVAQLTSDTAQHSGTNTGNSAGDNREDATGNRAEPTPVSVLLMTQSDTVGDLHTILATPGVINLHDSVTDEQGNRFYIQEKRRETPLLEEFGLFRLQNQTH